MSQWTRVGTTADGHAHWVARCATAAEFLNPPARLSDCRESEATDDPQWRGSATYLHGEELIRAGWPDGAAKAREMAEKLDGVLAAAARQDAFRTEWDVAGEEPDVARFLGGDPECMAASVPVPAEGPAGTVVRFAVKGGGSAMVAGEVFTRAAVLIAAAVDRAEAAGRRAEVWVYYAAKFGPELAETWHLLKAAEDPLDLPRMAAGMHPAGFRRIGWRWRESRACLKESHGYGRSQTTELPAEPGEIRLDAVQVGRVLPGAEAAWLKGLGLSA